MRSAPTIPTISPLNKDYNKNLKQNLNHSLLYRKKARPLALIKVAITKNNNLNNYIK